MISWALLLWFLAVQSAASPAEVRHEPLILRECGQPDMPVVFDGKGLVIDVSEDVTDADWEQDGDVWMARTPFQDHPPLADTQRAALFTGEFPIRIARDRSAEQQAADAGAVIYVAPENLPPGHMGFRPDGAIYFRWPLGRKPGSARIFLPPAGPVNAVSIECSYITVRNVTAMHASNDGFNIHGPRVGIRLENIRALSNGDEGISAHDTVEMVVDGAEVAWNGSLAGGIADIDQSVTSYSNCEVHHNLGAAFFFAGKSHQVTNCAIHDQPRDFMVSAGTEVRISGIQSSR